MATLNIKEFLDRDEQKDLLRFLTAGSVDDGKSTLIGRLLFDSKKIYEDQLDALERDSKRMGNAGDHIDYALLLDGLKAEREQGITIDVAYRYFSTNNRKFIIADTPGHEQYTRNMITGGSTANLAIILVDARTGVITQTRRHTYLVSLLGIKHVVLAVNKMDLVDFDKQIFDKIVADYKAFVKSLNIPDITYIPLSALDGDNVVDKSDRTPWYEGPSLLDFLETVPIDQDRNFEDFRYPVQYVLRPNLDFRGFCGKVSSGIVRKGDTVMALPSRKTSKVKSIVTYDGELDYAFPPQCVTITQEDRTGRNHFNIDQAKNLYTFHTCFQAGTPAISSPFRKNRCIRLHYSGHFRHHIGIRPRRTSPVVISGIADNRIRRSHLIEMLLISTYNSRLLDFTDNPLIHIAKRKRHNLLLSGDNRQLTARKQK